MYESEGMSVEERTDEAHWVGVLNKITYFMISPSTNLLPKHMAVLTLVPGGAPNTGGGLSPEAGLDQIRRTWSGIER